LDKDSKEYLQVEVIDTGVGISKKDQEKLFKLFGFVETTSSMNTHGIGLGLVISQNIVNVFDGQINVHSVPEEGSTFSFQFLLEDH